MSGPVDGGGFLARLRANETLQKLSRGRPDLIIFGAPILLIAIIALGVAAVAMASGGRGDDTQAVTTATSEPATPQTTATQSSAGVKTPIAFGEGDQLTIADLALRGPGEPARGEFLAERLIIPKLGVDAAFSYKLVGPDGQMPNPNGAWDVAYYDFGQWPGLGGLPNAGGNVVMAGHVDYINVGPAVFWGIDTLATGDRIQVRMQDGTMVEYAVEFNKWVGPGDMDWSLILAGTADESITLITCTGEFSAGHYDKRQVVWGRRVV